MVDCDERNLDLVAGRYISAEEEAMGQVRLIPFCSATGEAAGTAAALALQQKITPRELDRFCLQKTLQQREMDLQLAERSGRRESRRIGKPRGNRDLSKEEG